jgi:hypothetical protein
MPPVGTVIAGNDAVVVDDTLKDFVLDGVADVLPKLTV